MKYERDWKEPYVDRMGLIVALSGQHRFQKLSELKKDMSSLPASQQSELKECLRQRFTPTNGQDGCSEAMASMRSI
jgi:hypothetical protein